MSLLRSFSKWNVALLPFLFFISSLALSQTHFDQEDAKRLHPLAKSVIMNDELNTPSFISMDKPFNMDPAKWINEFLGCDDETKMELDSIFKTDRLGFTKYAFREYHQGLPVEHGIYFVHVKQGQIVMANGRFVSNIQYQLNTERDLQSCWNAAINHMKTLKMKPINNGSMDEMNNANKLIIRKDGEDYLCYRFEIKSIAPFAYKAVYVNVEDLKIMNVTEKIICTDTPGTANCMYYGTKAIVADSYAGGYRLRDNARGVITWDMNTSTSGEVDFVDADNNWTTTTNDDHAAFTAHWGMEGVYDYYLEEHSRNSFDDAGATINSYVHYDLDYTNAFWDGSGFSFGDGGPGYTPLVSLDIVAHEYTHAVTQYTAGLVYSYESGALNESFSDMFGAIIDFAKSPETANYLMGEMIATDGVPFRNMSNPNATGQPDTYEGNFWEFTSSDNGGVHTNSQVMNYWFYLLSAGGSGINDNGDAYDITSIGINNVASILYRTLSIYFIPTSEYIDARNFTIQSAIDLFGACSPEVIQVTNAWYAVGIGEPFQDTVIASFESDRNFLCSAPATVNFSSTSINATSFFWDFGDGTNSTEENPTHIYELEGTYTVSLAVEGSSLCATGTAEHIEPNFITVQEGYQPLPATCITNNLYSTGNYGISHVSLNEIDNTTLGGIEDYQDYTCGQAAFLVAGDNVAFNVTTFGLEYLKIWIDLDNNGSFDNVTELFYSSASAIQNHQSALNLPSTVIINAGLRMRITSSTSTITNSCSNPNYGQTEDYTIVFLEPTSAPIADFIASPITVNVNANVNFTDLSEGGVTSWQWSIPGGIPSSSTLENPVVTYPSVGDYSVTLIVSNEFGIDTIEKINYIHVVNTYNMCSTTTSSTPSGILYDSGGPTGNYSNSQYCNFTISPSCADSVIINIAAFNTEGCCDYLYIYDGTNSSGPMLFFDSGTTTTTTVVAASGSAYIVWDTDGSVTYSGFELNWESVLFDPEASSTTFTVSNTNPALGTEVEFTDTSVGLIGSWLWDFGDGQISNSQNPVHIYNTPGTYLVSLTTNQCGVITSATQTIEVQAEPNIIINEIPIEIDIACNGDSILNLPIHNTGFGDLVVSVNGHSTGGIVNVLSLTSGSDLSTEYPHTIAAISAYFTNYNLVESASTLASVIAPLLAEADVLLLPENESGSSTIYTNIASIVSEFVNNGGVVIQCFPSATMLNTLGLFNTSGTSDVSFSTLNVVDNTNPITLGFPSTITGSNATYAYNLTNTDIVPLVTSFSNEVVAYRNIGSGRAYLIGFDYYLYSAYDAQIIANSVSSFGGTANLPDWLEVTNPDLVIAPDAIEEVQLLFNADGLYAGTYSYDLTFVSNDPDSLEFTTSVILNVTGEAEISSSAPCILFGEIPTSSMDESGVWIYNTGCDTLWIDNMILDGTDFSIGNYPEFIVPHDSTWLDVSIYADQTINYSSTINITSNSEPISICLSATGVEDGGLVVNTNDLYFDISSCDATFDTSIVITNHNDYPIDFEILDTIADGGIIDIVAFTYGVDLTEEWYNMNNIISAQMSNYTLTLSSASTAAAVSAALIGKDVALLPECQDITSSFYSNISSVVENFVSLGGKAIVCGQPDITYTNNLGLFTSIDYNFYGASGTTITVLDSPINDGVPASFTSPNAVVSLEITDPDFIVTSTDALGLPIMGSKNIGAGLVIYLGFDYYSTNTSASQLLLNALNYQSLGIGNILDADPTSGSLDAEEQQTIQLHFTSSDYSNGVYEFDLIISSTELPLSFDTVHVVMNVSGPACTDFDYTLNCGNTVVFQNLSTNNPITNLWDFGDAITSTLASPTHTYLTEGVYTISLTTCNEVGCATTSQTITIDNANAPIPPSCVTNNSYSYSTYGISNVQLADINYSSGSALDDYEDYSCTIGTELIRGDNYPISVTTLNTEYVVVWIDYNNNGIFETPLETAFSATANYSHLGTINIPLSAVTNTPLRMRVTSDDYSFTSPCYNPFYGQTEDYRVTIVDASGPPVVDFVATPLSGGVGQNISFTELVLGGATSFEWSFPGANTTSSTLENPVVTYPTTGYYTVTLIASNAFGSDTMTKVNYIEILNQYNLCDVLGSTEPSGTFFDPGGPTGNYGNNNYCTFLIDPGCAESITLQLNSFSTESCCDYIYVYDGTSTAGTLLGSDSGTPTITTLTANSGTMYIVWDSDGSSVSTGFQFSWTSVLIPTEGLAADFSISNTNPALNSSVEFTNQSVGVNPQYHWSFGDGVESTLTNPDHTYTNPGFYTVTLIANSCGNSDTISYEILVQDAPEITVEPLPIEIEMNCAGNVTIPVNVMNSGFGELNFYLGGESDVNATQEVLALSYGTDTSVEYPNTLSAINSVTTNYNLTVSNSSTIATILPLMEGKDIILLPELETGSSTFYTNLSPYLIPFVENGGTVILCGAFTSTLLTATGLFSGTYYNTTTSPLTVVNTTDELTTGLPATFIAPNATNLCTITNPDKVSLVKNSTYDAVTYRNIGLGRAYYFGFDFYQTNTQASTLIGRAIQINNNSGYTAPDWIAFDDTPQTTEVGDTTTMNLEITLEGYDPGTYSYDLMVYSNDESEAAFALPIVINIIPAPSIQISSECIDFGNVQQFEEGAATFTIQNNGCGDLEIFDIYLDQSMFSIISMPDLIAPGETGIVELLLNGDNYGVFNGTATVFNNDQTIDVCLTAVVIPSPIIELNTHSLDIALNQCDGIYEGQFEITNSGVGALDFQTQGFEESIVHILVLTNGVNTSAELPNLLASLDAIPYPKQITVSANNTANSIESDLVGKDVVIIPEGYIASLGYYTSIGPVIENFISNGGNAVINAPATPTQLQNLGLFNITASTWASNFDVNVVGSNALVNGVASTFVAPSSSLSINVANSEFVSLIEYNSKSVFGMLPIGLGAAIYLGFDYSNTNATLNQLLENSVMYNQFSELTYLNVANETGTLNQDELWLVNFTINPNAMEPGAYTASILVQSNDLQHPDEYVSLNISVSGIPCTSFDYSSTCSGYFEFHDQSTNGASSFSWMIDDVEFSTDQNPSHFFADNGNHNVTLNACNTYGCSTSSQTIQITNDTPLIPAECYPNAQAQCCGIGISHISILSDSYSLDLPIETASIYNDYTCNEVAYLEYNSDAICEFVLNEQAQFAIYLDYNNNGLFEPSELLQSGTSSNANFSFIPTQAILDQFIRMRIVTESVGQSFELNACFQPINGIVLDLTVFVIDNAGPPEIDAEMIWVECENTVSFLNNAEIETSYHWDFGDGNSSEEVSPSHTYNLSNTYLVTLTASNAYGSTIETFEIVIEFIQDAISFSGNQLEGIPISFSVNDTYTAYSWDFGDGYAANIASPNHSYLVAGTYDVEVTVSTPNCSETITTSIEIGPNAIIELSDMNSFVLYPNPTRKDAFLDILNLPNNLCKVELYNAIGQFVCTPQFYSPSNKVNRYVIQQQVSGVYFVRITYGENQKTLRLIFEE